MSSNLELDNRQACAVPKGQRAAQVFVFEEEAWESPFVEKIWRTHSEPVESFISVATSNWEIVVTRQARQTDLWVRGPETKASTSPIPQGAEFFGIRFKHGSFMPHLPIGHVVDGAQALPKANGKAFWLNGSLWEFPDFDNADAFIGRLVHEELLVRDPLVQLALRQECVRELSIRSVERRVLRTTGLTRGAIRQIARANRAVELLEQGMAILDVVDQAEYADQAHLTRSLKRFIGQTPAEIVLISKAR